MKKMVLSVMLAVLLAGSGCIDATSVVELKPDGSGRIVETIYLSAAAMGMMGGMAAGMGEGAEVSVNANPLMNEDQARGKVAKMGEGVTFRSITEVTKPDGSKGAQIIYDFKDISKLKMSMGGDGMVMGGPGEEPGGDEAGADAVKFGFSAGNLTIAMPEPPKGEEVQPAPEPADPQAEAMAEQMMQGMLPMFKGMRMRVLVKIPSEIKETNAKYVGVAPDTKKKQYITLMDMDMDALLANPEGTKKLMELQKMKDQAKIMKAFEGMEGIKVETEKKISVKF